MRHFDLSLHLNLVQGDTEVILQRSLILTNDQILALPTTPIKLVDGPGAGKYLFPIMAIIETNFAGGALGNVSSGLSTDLGASDFVVTVNENVANVFRASAVVFHNGLGNLRSVAVCSPVQPTYPRVPAETDTWANVYGYPENGFDQIENAPWYISADNADGNFTGGHANNRMLVSVYYTIRTFGVEP